MTQETYRIKSLLGFTISEGYHDHHGKNRQAENGRELPSWSSGREKRDWGWCGPTPSDRLPLTRPQLLTVQPTGTKNSSIVYEPLGSFSLKPPHCDSAKYIFSGHSIARYAIPKMIWISIVTVCTPPFFKLMSWLIWWHLHSFRMETAHQKEQKRFSSVLWLEFLLFKK